MDTHVKVMFGMPLVIIAGISMMNVGGQGADAQSATPAADASVASSAAVSKTLQSAPKRHLAPVSEMAIASYTRDDYPAVVAKFGSAIPAINRDRKAAADIAALDERCDRVTNVQIASRSPKANRKYWAECGNLTRFRFDEQSLAKGEVLTVQTRGDFIRDGLIQD
jgi:hypothetical protein